MNFNRKLLSASEKNKSWLCVGLDSDLRKIPGHLGSGPEAVLKFNRLIIEATSDLVCAYKPNSAFYESLGAVGMEILKNTIDSIPDHIPVILDFKRGDIRNTAAMYAKSAFEYFGADAVTVSPFLGIDSIEPFMEFAEKGVFVLCLTSNRSSSELQKRLLLLDDPPSLEDMSPQSKAKTMAEFLRSSTIEVYMHIAKLAMEWNKNGNIGLVVGATSPGELKKIRNTIGEDVPLLIPGIGAQGGDLENVVIGGANSIGEMAIINVSRGIIYVDDGPSFQDSVLRQAEEYRNSIRELLEKKKNRQSE